jgi:hypothetical protein
MIEGGISWQCLDYPTLYIFLGFIPIYILARLSLIVLPFTTLRALPPRRVRRRRLERLFPALLRLLPTYSPTSQFSNQVLYRL